MKEPFRRIWQSYSNLILATGGKKPDAFTRWADFWWNHPLGEVVTAAFLGLKRRVLPGVHLPPAPQLTNPSIPAAGAGEADFVRVLYGCLYGF